MNTRVRIAMAMAASLIFVAPSSASDCSDAIDAYNAATAEIDYRLRRYVRCVESSQGSDDCSTEFRRLRSAHSDFESAVSSYRSECE